MLFEDGQRFVVILAVEPRLHQRHQLLFVARACAVIDEARILAEFRPADGARRLRHRWSCGAITQM